MIPVAANPYPLVFAHRGGGMEAPENSMAAFRRLGELGIKYLETDAQLTADGQVVLCHDETLDRTYGTEGKVSDYTYEELLEFPGEAGEPMPLLRDVLAEFPDLFLNIDAKTSEVAEPLVELLLETGDMGRVMIASFSERRLERIREIGGPEVSTSLGVGAIVKLMLASETASKAENWGVPGPADHTRAAQVPVKSKGIPVVSPRFIATAHGAGLAVHVWTVNDPAEMERLFAMGVDGIVTDVPSVAKEVLQGMGLWDPASG